MAEDETTGSNRARSYADWIEVYNDSATATNLAGWRLTDNASDPVQWAFPSTHIAAAGSSWFGPTMASSRRWRVGLYRSVGDALGAVGGGGRHRPSCDAGAGMPLHRVQAANAGLARRDRSTQESYPARH